MQLLEFTEAGLQRAWDGITVEKCGTMVDTFSKRLRVRISARVDYATLFEINSLGLEKQASKKKIYENQVFQGHCVHPVVALCFYDSKILLYETKF